MEPQIRHVTSPEEARALAPFLDARAAEFQTQFSDDDYPAGAAERFIAAHLDDRETVLLAAEAGGEGSFCGLCLVGGLVDPLLATATPTILVLHVEPAWRHRGLAGRLVAEADRILADRGLTHLAARVGHNDDALISMGERWGFVRHWELMLRE